MRTSVLYYEIVLIDIRCLSTNMYLHSEYRQILCEFFLHGNENTRFYFTKTKRSSYYLNLFHESIYFRNYVGFPHPGLNVSPNIFSPAVFFSLDRRVK